MNIIDKSTIKSLNPYKTTFEYYLKFYGDRSFTKAQFMGLKNITHEDKLWIAFRLMPPVALKDAVINMSENVLPVFENKYPNDERPRYAIERAKSTSGFVPLGVVAQASVHAASDVKDKYCSAAALTAAYAVYASNSNHTSFIIACAVNAAASFRNCGEDKKAQEKAIRKIILKYWKLTT